MDIITSDVNISILRRKIFMKKLVCLLLALLTVWVVITVTFFIMHAVPGDPFTSEKALPPAAKERLEEKFGLDKPLIVQYFNYLGDVVFKFDFGPSLKKDGMMVQDIIGNGLKTSAKLGVIAAAIAVAVGVVLGAVGVYKPLVEFGGAGATVPLTGFGYVISTGVREAVNERGMLGAITGPLTAAAGGTAAALVFGLVASLLCHSKPKK